MFPTVREQTFKKQINLQKNKTHSINGVKLIRLPTKPLKSYKIGDVIKSPLQDELYDSIFTNDKKKIHHIQCYF